MVHPSRWLHANLAALLAASAGLWSAAAAPVTVQVRHRAETAPGSGRWNVSEQSLRLDAKHSAIVICDMWDKHWCAGATRRVAEMAPRMNAMVRKARSEGFLIIHCPSDTMGFYEGSAQRKLAQAAPKVETSVPLQPWCRLDPAKEPPLPIDDSDGGCDDWPACKNYKAWSRQIAAIEVEAGDAVTDSAEAYYLMRQRGITNVLCLGVHLNMCVLGRPFSIRQMAGQGQNVLLVRDLTDTMYNSRKAPFVPHCAGTGLMIEHVEKYWCGSIASSDFLGGEPFRFAEDKPSRIVFMIGEDEYKTWETLPEFAKSDLGWRGLGVSIVLADAQDPHRFPGMLEALKDADLVFVSVRRRTPDKKVLEAIRAHLDAGKPLVGIRTASHAFALRSGASDLLPPDGSRAVWPEFDHDVLGGNYNNHHGNGPKTSLKAAGQAQGHPILNGVDWGSFQSSGSLYKASPLAASAQALLLGSVPGQPEEPVAWVNTYGSKKARVFYTSLGHPDDFKSPVFRRLLLNGVLWALDRPVPQAPPGQEPKANQAEAGWRSMKVPGTWEDNAGLAHDGFAWYRCLVRIPANWLGASLRLAVEKVDNAYEAYFNGVKLGGAGAFPPHYANGLEQPRSYDIASNLVQVGDWNIVQLRIYDQEGRGGFKGPAPMVVHANKAIALSGEWQFRAGDDPGWAKATVADVRGGALFHDIVSVITPAGSVSVSATAASPGPLAPADALKSFTVPSDLELELVLAEPEVAQPLQLSFDERGRLWVVEYRQYPAPAGLELVSHDEWWRAVYDKIPLPPPRGVRGKDRISIHEDTDGDGAYDRHKVFVDGLNIATSCARGQGGVWVLNPPYLLFYPDRNNDDVPDGDPEVHLSGFGLEDTHSVVNSLRWGPDGWLYAAQGSTVSAKIQVHEKEPEKSKIQNPKSETESKGANTNQDAEQAKLETQNSKLKNPQSSQGQNIWRYHPGLRRYEVFAEGGGNAFGVEIDAKGRVFSGHNGGDTRGFHYMQGAYLRKGFEKHGELSNPYAFGYFPHMPHNAVERFTHTFIVYEADALPPRYRGKLFGVEPLQGRVVMSEITADGSTFRTQDIERPVITSDRWFKPVDIKVGPDGAIYIADWYDAQVNHWRNYQGNMDASNGRVYRLKAKGAPPAAPFDLSAWAAPRLIELLHHDNPWFRQTALRVLGDRRETAAVEPLLELAREHSERMTLEELWALARLSRADEGVLRVLLTHKDWAVRAWATRLLGDRDAIGHATAAALAKAAGSEGNIEVRAQLACTAKRLPADQSLPLIRALLARDEDAAEARQPLLLWWALESKAASDRDQVIALFDDSSLWDWPLVRDHLLERLMRRYAASGAQRDLLDCARLIERSPSREHSVKLMAGFEEAFKGRSLTGLPEPLVAALASRNLGSPAFQLRQGRPEVIVAALKAVGDSKADAKQRRQFIEVFGEVKRPEAVPVLLDAAAGEGPADVRKAALTALLIYDDPGIGSRVAEVFAKLPAQVRPAAETLLSSRPVWCKSWLGAMAEGRVPLDLASPESVRRLRETKDKELEAMVARLWPDAKRPATADMEKSIQRLAGVVRGGTGNPYQGKELFNAACAVCHRLFSQGGEIGPDLTAFQRTDVDNVLLSIVNPSAEIREGYENIAIETRDGRSLAGFVAENDSRVVVLRGLDGQRVTLNRSEIAAMKPAGLSLMPEGLLEGLEDQQVRDLFAYLRSSQPLP